MRTCLVTGAAGFIGSHLTDALLARGDAVIALDNLSQGSLDNLESASRNPNLTFFDGDIRDAELVGRLTAGSDIVFHLAARIGLKLVLASALETLNVNTRGTEVVLEAAAARGCRTIVASTSEVYGLTEKYPSAESDPLVFGSPRVPRWSYAASKAFDEFMTLALFRERALPATALRLFNTVGPRQSARYGMVLPRFVQQALDNEPLTVYGDGTQSRCFCSVHDVVRAILAIVDEPATQGEVYNLGSDDEITVMQLAKRVIAAAASHSTIALTPFESAYNSDFEEIVRRVPDIGKLQRATGFTPRVTLDEIITSVIENSRKVQPIA